MTAQKDLLSEAIKLGEQFYGDQKKLSGEFVATHAQRVVDNLKKIGITDEETLIVAYLHHIPLDTSTQDGMKAKEAVTNKLGGAVYQLIQQYSIIRKNHINSLAADKINAGYIIQTYFNLTKDIRLLLVRLADKVEDSKSLQFLPIEERSLNAEKLLVLYSPVCHILGISSFSRELENNAFKALNPEKYLKIESYIKSKKPRMEKAFKEIDSFVRDICKERDINVLDIFYRVKSPYSVYRKMNKDGRDIKEIRDLAALTILVQSVEGCYAVEDVLQQAFDINMEHRDDYIRNPKLSGYRSIHNIVSVYSDVLMEVQIKTNEMHEHNEFGLASHAFYKIGEVLKQQAQSNPELLKELNVGTLKESENKTLEHFSDSVYVFTPKGRVIKLPKDSNVIDFAFALHGDIGISCTFAKVNGMIVKLNHVLKDGDVIEIITSSKSKPSADWLKDVKTSKARRLIRRELKLDED